MKKYIFGSLLLGFLAFAGTAISAAPVPSPTFDSQWNDTLRLPRDVATTPNGNIVVVDTGNDLIKVFNSTGNFLFQFGGYNLQNPLADGKLNLPLAAAVDKFGNIYVADTENHRIQKFDAQGNFVTKWGSYGSIDGQFMTPISIAVDKRGSVFVSDNQNHRIQKFDSIGNFLLKWGQNNPSATDHLPVPLGISVDNAGFVLVSSDFKIKKFNPNTGKFMSEFGSFGSGDGQFMTATDIAVDTSGFIYVSETTNQGCCEVTNNRVQVFTNKGKFVTKFGSLGTGDGEFSMPWGITIDDQGNIFVADTFNNRIQKFMTH